jgi:phosphoribosylformylglycinamidine cyclo-ligase
MTDYKSAGVDIDAGEELVNRIKPMVASTSTSGCLGRLGAFGGFFKADFGGMKEPVLVSSVDGVGTKLKLAFMTGLYDTVGQDLVNHCVNDILCCGAKPLFFLDYFATGELNVDAGVEVISGFTKACKENNCALIGGETAEMPGLYKKGEFDLSGTIVGVVEKDNIINGESIKAGDKLIALPSSGLHTNGYSLARKVLFEDNSVRLDKVLSDGRCLAQHLLAVHKSYLKPVGNLLDNFNIKGLSHITGGGIYGNTSRVLPDDLWIQLDDNSWQWPDIFKFIQSTGGISTEEMYRAFNLGIGMIIIVSAKDEEAVFRNLESEETMPVKLGSVIKK